VAVPIGIGVGGGGLILLLLCAFCILVATGRCGSRDSEPKNGKLVAE
jgi:hypothetical protein